MPENKQTFQQDNGPKHISRKAQQQFEDNDINPLEHLWFHLKSQLQKYVENITPAKEIHELWNRLVKKWNTISAEVCQKLIESMSRKKQAVIKTKGEYTKYQKLLYSGIIEE